jgi:hypothetical protein
MNHVTYAKLSSLVLILGVPVVSGCSAAEPDVSEDDLTGLASTNATSFAVEGAVTEGDQRGDFGCAIRSGAVRCFREQANDLIADPTPLPGLAAAAVEVAGAPFPVVAGIDVCARLTNGDVTCYDTASANNITYPLNAARGLRLLNGFRWDTNGAVRYPLYSNDSYSKVFEANGKPEIPPSVFTPACTINRNKYIACAVQDAIDSPVGSARNWKPVTIVRELRELGRVVALIPNIGQQDTVCGLRADRVTYQCASLRVAVENKALVLTSTHRSAVKLSSRVVTLTSRMTQLEDHSILINALRDPVAHAEDRPWLLKADQAFTDIMRWQRSGPNEIATGRAIVGGKVTTFTTNVANGPQVWSATTCSVCDPSLPVSRPTDICGISAKFAISDDFVESASGTITRVDGVAVQGL